MRLRRVEVEGYRSIKGPIELHCDPRVTVVLGANDHGKTNLLEALRHLNRDHPFNPASDLNWDFEDQREQLPRVEFEFTIEQPEKDEFEAIFAENHSQKQRPICVKLKPLNLRLWRVAISLNWQISIN